MENFDKDFLKDELPKFILEYAEKTVDNRVNLHLNQHHAWMKKVDAFLQLHGDTIEKDHHLDLQLYKLIGVIWDLLKAQGYTSEQIGQKLEAIITSHDESTKELEHVKEEISTHGEVITSLSGTLSRINKYILGAQVILVVCGIIISTAVITINWANLNTLDTWKGLLFAVLPLCLSGAMELLKRRK